MDNYENEEILDAVGQDVDGTNDENDVSATGSDESKKAFEDQKRRAEKAEAELKALKAEAQEPTEKKAQPTLSNSLSREEAILIAEGMKEDDLNKLQVIARGAGISLLEAKEDPLFASYYSNVMKERKSEKAKLGASKGSTIKQETPSFSNGLSRDEHIALWKETNN